MSSVRSPGRCPVAGPGRAPCGSSAAAGAAAGSGVVAPAPRAATGAARRHDRGPSGITVRPADAAAGRIERDPAVAREVHLDPGVRVAVADGLGGADAASPRQEPLDEPGRDRVVAGSPPAAGSPSSTRSGGSSPACRGRSTRPRWRRRTRRRVTSGVVVEPVASRRYVLHRDRRGRTGPSAGEPARIVASSSSASGPDRAVGHVPCSGR